MKRRKTYFYNLLKLKYRISVLGMSGALLLSLSSFVSYGQSTSQAPEVTASSTAEQKEPPKLLNYAAPKYSNDARRAQLSGTCILSIVVDQKGKPQDVRVLKSLAEEATPALHDAAVSLDKNAMKAVKKYRFAPATQDGKAVAAEIKVVVNFHFHPKP